MKIKRILFILCTIALMVLALFGYNRLIKRPGREIIDEKYAAALVKDKLSLSGDVTAQKLLGGFSGAQLFTVTSGPQKYVVRFLQNKSKEERKREISILQIASQEDYGPHVYFVDFDQAVVIMEFLQNQNISPELLQSGLLYELLAKFLQKIHKGPKFEDIKDRNIFNRIHKMIQYLEPKCSKAIPTAKIENIIERINQALESHVDIAPCHNDLHFRNLLFVNDSLLGDKFKAIDYEEACQGDPYFDIVMVALSYCENSVHENILLSKYLGRQPFEKEIAKLYLMKQVALIYPSLSFLTLIPEKLHKYEKLQVPSHSDFMKEMGEGKVNLDEPEDKLKFAKVLINHVIANSESQEFKHAVNVLRKI